MENKKLKILLHNLDDITKTTLSFFFKSNLCRNAEISEYDDKAELVVADFDRNINDDFLNMLDEKNRLALILHSASKTPTKHKRVLWLKKPIQAKLLQDKIEIAYKHNITLRENKATEIAVDSIKLEPKSTNDNDQVNTKNIKKSNNNSHLSLAVKEESEKDIQKRYRAHKFVGSNPDIDPNNIRDLELIYHTPEKYIYFQLAKAVKKSNRKKLNIVIKTIYGNIFYDKSDQTFNFNFEESKIKFIQTTALFADTKFKEIDKKIVKQRNYKHKINAQKMIWISAIYASKGRLPQGTNIQGNVRLYNWPNFTKLRVFRYAIQITAAWSRNSLSLFETAKQLRIPQRYVFTLYTAINAISHADIETSDIPDKNSIIEEKQNKSIFSKILSHIFNK